LAKTISGKVVAVDFDIDVQKKAGGTYKGWSLTYRGPDGKTESFTKPMAGLKFQASLKGALQELKPGDEFVGQLEKNKDDYWELTSLSKGGNLPVQNNAEQYRSNRSASNDYSDPRQVSIVRQSSLKSAVDYYAALPAEEQLGGMMVLDIAEKFEAWVNRKDAE
jgi:hypothetical protein